MTITFCFIALTLAGSSAASTFGNRRLEFGRTVTPPAMKESKSKLAATVHKNVRGKGKIASMSTPHSLKMMYVSPSLKMMSIAPSLKMISMSPSLKMMSAPFSQDSNADKLEFLELDQELFQSMSLSMSYEYADPWSPNAPSHSPLHQSQPTSPNSPSSPTVDGSSGSGSGGSGSSGNGSGGSDSSGSGSGGSDSSGSGSGGNDTSASGPGGSGSGGSGSSGNGSGGSGSSGSGSGGSDTSGSGSGGSGSSGSGSEGTGTSGSGTPGGGPSESGPPAASNPSSPSAPSLVTVPSYVGTPYPTFVTAPSQAPLTPAGSPTPTVSNSSAFTGSPTFTDTTSYSPVGYEETSSAPTTPSVVATTVFGALGDTVVIVQPPFVNTTVVRLEIEYLVETFLERASEFTEDLDWMILETAVMASLRATNSGVLARFAPGPRRLAFHKSEYGPKSRRQLLSSSSFLRSCNATLGANCYIMKADILYILNGARNADMAAYLAYLALSNEMGSFDEDLEDVSRVEYLAPQAVLPAVAAESQQGRTDGLLSSRKTEVSVHPWTVGAAVACSTGGLLALMVWNRNRKTRNRRHIQLLEDVSLGQTTAPREGAQVVSHPV